jgi:hypothetical protein
MANLDEAASSWVNRLRSSPGTAPLRFPPGEDITILSALLPPDRRPAGPPPEGADPDHVESYQYADIDSLIELHGHIRAVNPDNHVKLRVPGPELTDDDRSSHLVLLGGVDWNGMVQTMYQEVGVPIRQRGRLEDTDSGAFEVGAGPRFKVLAPTPGNPGNLTDVGHFLRAPNPYLTTRKLLIFNASYALGVYGMVRALTDARVRDRNAGYLARTFAQSDTASILCHVQIIPGGIRVPDWEASGTLHTWPED